MAEAYPARGPRVRLSAGSMWANVTWTIAKRSVILISRLPSAFFPSLIMPVFLTISFSGAFSGIVNVPGFPAEKALDWFIPMTTVQGAAFTGVTTGMGLVRDLESGFYDRLLASPASRSSLLSGTLLAAMFRSLAPLVLLTLIAIFAGATFHAGAASVVMLAIACLGVSLAAGAWAVGLALRFKTMQITPLMQTGMFLGVFLSTAQMPIHLLTGWLHDVARFNPMTNVLALARQGFLGAITWDVTWPGLLAIAGMAGALVLFSARGMAKVIP
ncbi:MAG: ABC transporter permease [Actinomycetota bacterium]|nr:ABC transporter permease [Actinomycetota bacterium]